MNGRLVTALDRIARLPGIHQLREARFNEAFVNGRAVGCCRGVFRSHAEAAAAAPETRPLGYDHVDAATMYHDRLERVYPSDYPMMLWLENAFADGARQVLDLGGHIGIAYYAYQRMIPFPADVAWRVHDVPAVKSRSVSGPDSKRSAKLRRRAGSRASASCCPAAITAGTSWTRHVMSAGNGITRWYA